jgi:hypothetical protein
MIPHLALQYCSLGSITRVSALLAEIGGRLLCACYGRLSPNRLGAGLARKLGRLSFLCGAADKPGNEIIFGYGFSAQNGHAKAGGVWVGAAG